MEHNSKGNISSFERINTELGELLEKFDDLVLNQEELDPENYNKAFMALLDELGKLKDIKRGS